MDWAILTIVVWLLVLTWRSAHHDQCIRDITKWFER
jgi:hypothetical protein